MSKLCRICNIYKSFEEFSKRKESNVYRNECKECRNALQNKYVSTFNGHFVQLLGHAKESSKNRINKGRTEAGVFNLTIEELKQIWNKQDGKCYYSGISMSYTSNDWCTSLERIDVTKGYVRDNVVLCCLEFNSCSQWSHKKIQEMTSLISKNSCITMDDFYPVKNQRRPAREVKTMNVDGVVYYKCNYCNEFKGKENYSRVSQCKECKNKYSKAYKNTPRGALKKLISSAKSHSKRRNASKNIREGEFEIDYDYLVNIFIGQNGLCYYSGIPMTFGEYKHTNWTCSLERKDPTKGYTKQNVCLICLEFNSIDHIVTMKNKQNGSSGWNLEKFHYFLKIIRSSASDTDILVV